MLFRNRFIECFYILAHFSAKQKACGGFVTRVLLNGHKKYAKSEILLKKCAFPLADRRKYGKMPSMKIS